MKGKQLLSILLTLVLFSIYIPPSKASSPTVLDITTGAITIGATGATGGGLESPETTLNPDGYIIDGQSVQTTNIISVDADVTTTITLRNTSILSSAPIKINQNAVVHLIIEGTNTLTANVQYNAGISIMSNAFLTISGDGSLTATGNSYAAGIGAPRSSMGGNITINSGAITAVGGSGGAGIGGCYTAVYQGTITINGGIINATGNLGAAGIGGGTNRICENIIINGGTINAQSDRDSSGVWGIGNGNSAATRSTPIIITGGSVNASVQGEPVNSLNERVYQVDISYLPLKDTLVQSYNELLEIWSATFDETGLLHTFLPSSANRITIKANSSIYIADVQPSETLTTVTLTRYPDDPCTCTDTTGSIDFSNQEISMNKNAESLSIKLNAVYVPATGCSFPLHGSKPVYTFTTPISPDIAKIIDNTLVLSPNAIGETISVNVAIQNNSITYEKSAEFSIVLDSVDVFDLSSGNIVIADDSVTVGSNQYSIDPAAPLFIKQSGTGSTTNTISVKSTSKTITLQNINIHQTKIDQYAMDINGAVTIILDGENVITDTVVNHPAIRCNLSSSLTLEGSGTLRATGSTSAAAIGGTIDGTPGAITINSGTIYATGGYAAAAIGGGRNGTKASVTINGGKIYATGSGGGAGLGNGVSGSNATITINNGYVSSLSDSLGVSGNLFINGGSLNANGLTQTQSKTDLSKVHFSTLTVDTIGADKVTYTIDSNPTEYTTYTDSRSNLYLYLPAGMHTIRVTHNATVYYKRFNISSTLPNMGMCTSNPEKNITSFSLPGQLRSQVDEQTKRILVTMPYNSYITSITPFIEYTGSSYSPSTPQDFSSSSTLPLTYTVIGDDENTQDYLVTVQKESSTGHEGPMLLDISQGVIDISTDMVRVGTSMFDPCPDGYIITGTTSKNVIYVNDGVDTTITLKDLSISYPLNAAPITVQGKSNIAVDGTVILKAPAEFAGFAVQGDGAVTLSGTGKLDVYGGNNSPAIGASAADYLKCGNITITNGNILAVGGNGAPAVGGHKYSSGEIANKIVITGGNVRLVNGDAFTQKAYITPVNELGEMIYAVCITLADGSFTNKKVQYWNSVDSTVRTMTTDANGNMYLYAPNGTYTFSVKYNNITYYGYGTVDNSGIEISAKQSSVQSLSYTDPKTALASNVLFSVNGLNLNGTIIVTATPNNGGGSISQTATKNASGIYTVTLAFPENSSTTSDIVYTLSATLDGRNQPLTGNTTIAKNKKLEISAFTINTQIGNTVFDNTSITVTMPYDQTEVKFAPQITHNGVSITPTGMRNFTNPVPYVIRASALNSGGSADTRTYTAKLVRQATPVAQSISFQNPSDYNAGNVSVVISGQHLDNAQNALSHSPNITVSADGLTSANAVKVGDDWIATLAVPENTDRTAAKTYSLAVTIGDVVQTLTGNTTLTVPRKPQNIASIESFTIAGQVGDTAYAGTNSINVTLPYDMSKELLTPTVKLTDPNSSYTPTGAQNFTSPVVYTVTAEDGITSGIYNVTVTNLRAPSVKGISFSNPTSSSGGNVVVTLRGDNLQNARNITVSSATGISESPVTLQNGVWATNILVPSNSDTENNINHILQVKVDNVIQILDQSMCTLTVPRRMLNAKDITDFLLLPSQISSAINNSNKTITVTVPYNTDLSSLIPQVSHTGTSYEPTTAQNFNNPVVFTVKAEDTTSKSYTVTVVRSGSASIDGITYDAPKTFSDTSVKVAMTGNILPTDSVVLTASYGDTNMSAVLTRDYGKAQGTLTLPQNTDTTKDAVYTLTATINSTNCDLGEHSTIRVPRRKSRAITAFSLPHQVGDAVINGTTISVNIPYQYNISNLTPIMTFDGDSCSPLPDTAQDFTSPVIYTINATDDVGLPHTVTVSRTGAPSISNVTINQPLTYKGGEVEVTVEGEFYNQISATISSDIDPSIMINGSATITQDGHATIVFSLPENTDTNSSSAYTLSITADNIKQTLPTPQKVVVPKKPKSQNSITSASVVGQIGVTQIDEYTISMITTQPITALEPTFTIPSSATISPTGVQDFTNPVVYTVTAEDGTTQDYIVSIQKASSSKNITSISISNQIGTSIIGENTIQLLTVSDITEITPVIQHSGVSISPTGVQDFTNPVVYTVTAEDGTTKQYAISITRASSTKQITSVSVAGQVGDTTFDGDTIRLKTSNDVTQIEPTITHNGVSFSPTGMQDFTNPIVYTVTAEDGTSKQYTISIVNANSEKDITAVLIPSQVGETVFNENTIALKTSTDITKIEPAITHTGVTISPTGMQDFTNPVTYTVAAQDGTTKEYLITINRVSTGTGQPLAPDMLNPNPDVTPTPIPTPDVTPTPTPTPEVTPTPAANKTYISGYEDGTFRPNNPMPRSEIAKILCVMDNSFDDSKTYASNLADVDSNAWYTSYVGYMYETKMMSGYDGQFKPNAHMTRAELATIIVRLLKIPEPLPSTSAFTDTTDHWAKSYISVLSEQKIISGYNDGTFKPDEYVTRAEAVTVLNKAFEITPDKSYIDALSPVFSDVTDDMWFYYDVMAVVKK